MKALCAIILVCLFYSNLPNLIICSPTPDSENCTAGVIYCGWQLVNLGYEIAERATQHLYRCASDGRAAYYSYCFDNCTSNTEQGAVCPCKTGDRYCGYSWRVDNYKLSNYHGVYECRENHQLHLTETCPDRCQYGQCTNTTETCNHLYCGFDLVQTGLVKSPHANWDWDAIYNCTNMNTPVGRCDGRCQHATSTACKPYTYAIKRIAGGD